ncbi:hypothetical protein V6U78_07385 [Marinospirillum sp. MEB164]|uniref:Uncharacterized protein n=1 Tax=Marinospirillum alkalitolerans TaxID=3123374 RepID=A0ABW8PX25_9GAMM
MTSKKAPIRIFLDPEDLAKLNHLAGDAMETPNKLGAFYLSAVVQAQHARRQLLLADGLDPQPKNLTQLQLGGGEAAAAAHAGNQLTSGV